MPDMEIRITATELARRVGEVLGKIRYRRDTFVVERNGEAVARMTPLASRGATLEEALTAWQQAPATDEDFADDLDRVSKADRPPKNPWVS
jgi:antitoxin (DNA-binding transcriptional repressor) of toxin-antitoxin stability system